MLVLLPDIKFKYGKSAADEEAPLENCRVSTSDEYSSNVTRPGTRDDSSTYRVSTRFRVHEKSCVGQGLGRSQTRVLEAME